MADLYADEGLGSFDGYNCYHSTDKENYADPAGDTQNTNCQGDPHGRSPISNVFMASLEGASSGKYEVKILTFLSHWKGTARRFVAPNSWILKVSGSWDCG